MMTRSFLKTIFPVGFFLIGAAFIAGFGLSAIGDPGTVRKAPVSLQIQSSPSLPADVAALETASLPLGFDRDTTSQLVMFETGSLTAALEPGSTISSLRIYGPAPYAISLSTGVRQGNAINWSAQSTVQNVDLSTLSEGWHDLLLSALGIEVAADIVQLTLVPVAGGSATGLSEIEFWGGGTRVEVATGAQALIALGSADQAGQIRRLSSGGAILRVTPITPTQIAAFDIGYLPSDIRRAWLSYDLKGGHSFLAVNRSLNGTIPLGGYVATDTEDWSHQLEAITPDLLIPGTNNIIFGILPGDEEDYALRDVELILELDEGHGLVEAGAVFSDANVVTGWDVPAATGTLEVAMMRRAAVDWLTLELSGAPVGKVTVEAQQADGTWAATSVTGVSLATNPSVITSGDIYRLAMDGVQAQALRVQIAGAYAGAYRIAEVRVSGSPIGPARAPGRIEMSFPLDGVFYERTAFLRGFVSPPANASGAAEIYVAGLNAASGIPFLESNGQFETLITKDLAGFVGDADDAPWSVDVVALYPDGASVSKTVVLDRLLMDEELSAYLPGVTVENFTPTEDKTVIHEEAELTIVAGALNAPTDIQISSMSRTQVAKLDTGMVNVTKGPRSGYRMLPSMKFNTNVSLKVPFDKKRIPQGYSSSDVRIFYFDEEAGRWIVLPENSVDEAADMVTGLTDHFTDFIAGVVVAPESPQAASFNPTQLKDIKVADPSARINLIAAPQATGSGDASLSYPFELPPGRQGMAPQLGLQYSSGGGNGWLGLGWSMSTPEISIDTRWGVPRYSATQETETYLMGGQQLTPVAHRGALVPREAERVFHTRVEGGFSKIIRHGTAPANYWWEVTDKMGTRYAYGGDLDSKLQLKSAVLRDAPDVPGEAPGNVFRWALTETRDTNGNRVKYTHAKVSDTGLVQGSVPGTQLYTTSILYTTSSATQQAPFEVKLLRDRDLADPLLFTPRKDRIIDGRGGFKMVTADLLKRVEVLYNGLQVRAYEMNYAEGAFHKTLLQSVTQFNAANLAFNTHTFEYYDDARESDGSYKGFATATPWTSPDDGIELGVIPGQDASVLSGTEASSKGRHRYIGYSRGYTKKRSIGVKRGRSFGTSEGRLMLIDLNGDGLPDKVFRNSSGVYLRLNESGPDGQTRFAATPVLVEGLPALSRETTRMKSRGLEAYSTSVSGGVNWSDTTSTTEVYFTDANGDGLPDLSIGGVVLFNVLSPAGIPTFEADSSLTAYPVGPAVVDAAAVQFDFDALFQQLVDDTPLVDSVRAWTAPYAGQVQITGDVALLADSSPERAEYETADGVRVAVEHNGLELFVADIAATDYLPKTPSILPLTVAKGDVIYFRVQSKFDGAYDQVSWAPAIAYVGEVATNDPNGLDVYSYAAAADFVPFSDKATGFTAPFDGTLSIRGTLNKAVQTTDDVTLELRKNGVVISSQTLAWDLIGSIPLLQDVIVQKVVADDAGNIVQQADRIELRLLSDSPVDLSKLSWSPTDQPRVFYSVSTDPGLPSLTDATGVNVTLQNLQADTTLYSQTDLAVPLVAWSAPQTGLFTFKSDVNLVTALTGLTTDITVTVKSGGARLAKTTLPVVGGVPQSVSFPLDIVTGQSYFFEFSNATPGILSLIAASGITVDLTPNNDSNDPVSVPTGFNGAERVTVLPQTYRGWRVFGYNGNRTRGAAPIAITERDLTGPSEAEANAAEQEIRDAIDAGLRNDAVVEANQQNLFQLFPAIVVENTVARVRWTSDDEDLWAEAGVQSATRYGENYISVPDIGSFAGAAAVPKISLTEQIGINAGFTPTGVPVSASGSGSTSTTTSLMDFLDINGDRFPDVVSDGKRVQFSPMIGGLEPSTQLIPSMLGNVRETIGSSSNFGLGGTFSQQTADGKGRIDVSGWAGSIGFTGLQMQPLGANASISNGSSDVSYDLRDVNADGLPDLVSNDGTALRVRFNLGYEFSTEEIYGIATINNGGSENISLGASLGGAFIGYNDGIYGFGGSVNASQGDSFSNASLADINGDGLIDAVYEGNANTGTIGVRLNSGSGFEPAIVWSTGGQGNDLADSAMVNRGSGKYVTFPVACFGLGFAPPCIVFNPGGDNSQSMSRLEVSIQDMDGDGFPEYLRSSDDAQLSVSFDTIERTNMLRRVNRPLGSTVTLSYDRSGNTTDQPQNKWVLARVEVFDGYATDGTDVLASAFTYENGYWDREEREFYGYATVTEDHLNTDALGGEAVYRTITREFLNDTYYNKGLMARSTTADAAGALFLETSNTYRFVDIATGTDVADAALLTATVFPQLIRTDNAFYEGQAAPGKTTFMTYDYDGYGNVTRYTDAANLDDLSDDVQSVIGYHEDLPAYIVGKADAVTVTGGARVYRNRTATFEPGTGNMLQLSSVLEDGTIAVTDLSYDGFGNLRNVTGPANASLQRYALDYTFDTEVNTYVTGITDSFGYSSAATYDVRFGEVLTTTDINGQPMAYTLDDEGRVETVTGPYEAGSVLTTISFAYHPKRDVPGDTQYPDVDVSWALTEHIDLYRNPSDTIDTALFIDGLGRVLQTKKDAAVFNGSASADKMVASGRITFDFLGRQTEQYYPVEEPLGQAGIFNEAYDDAVQPTTTAYDILDRPVQVTIPDNSATTMVYDFGPDRSGATQFRTLFTDANGNSRETYADVRKLMTSVKEINPISAQPVIWTSYIYDPLRQITTVSDDQNNVTTAEYDNFGRMTALDSPDAGRTTYRFDLASNLVGKQTANLRAQGTQITYSYDFNRLAAVTYPQFTDNNITYTYGAPGAAFNRANRITTVTSQAGTEERFYGPLGEMIKQTRTIASDTQGNCTTPCPEIYTTQWTYDTWNRLQEMTYPDGEVLINSYDSGGKLVAIDGAKAGYSYPYLQVMAYDKFGQRAFMRMGNGTETSYDYVPTTRRLDGLIAGNAQGRTFQSLSYAYDLVGNITGQSNAAAVQSANQLGGATSYTYTYDNLYRLTGATGSWEYQPGKTESFSLAMSYDTIHNITSKDQQHIRTQPSNVDVIQRKTSYNWAYAYTGAQPHAPDQIGVRAFSYDANGNQTGWDNTTNGTRRTITWDEENRIQAIADNGHTKSYKYDDAGQRVIKRGPQGETAYVNQFYTMRNRELGTKHVYAGGTRLASKLVKDADGDGVPDATAGNSSQAPWGWINNGNPGARAAKAGPQVFEKDQYYFHPDHLGSSSYVTDIDGELFQHLEYFPFGETWVEESSNTQRTPYLFTAKELDEETGLYYFGARYYDPRTSVWQSTDPVLTKYMASEGVGQGILAPRNLSLYAYSHNRPVIMVDPDGKEPYNGPNSSGARDFSYEYEMSYYGRTGQLPPGSSDVPSWRETHYSRNQYNTGIPTTLPENPADAGLRELPPEKSIFHQQGVTSDGVSNESNRKFVSIDGTKEAVYDIEGNLVTDEVNQGTFNFAAPEDVVGHISKDVLPYYLWGNSENDPTVFSERLGGTYTGDVTLTPEERRLGDQQAYDDALAEGWRQVGEYFDGE